MRDQLTIRSDELRELQKLASFQKLDPARQKAVLEILGSQNPYNPDGSLNPVYHDAEREALGLRPVYTKPKAPAA